MGLRLRIAVLLALPTVIVAGAHGVLRMRQERAELLDAEHRTMAVTARAVQVAVENALRDRQTSDVRRLLTELVERQDRIEQIRLYDRRLESRQAANLPDTGQRAPGDVLRRVLATGTPESFHRRGERMTLVHFVVPLGVTQEGFGGVMEIVGVAPELDRRIHAAVVDILVRLGLLVGILGALTAVVLRREVLRPLGRLAEGLGRVGRGESGPPLAVERGDELGAVAAVFNRMTGDLDAARRQAMAEGRRVVELERELRRAATLATAGKLCSALAHEVGTPLNIISGRAEVALRALPPESPARADLEAIVQQIDRITTVIRGLLDTVRPQPLALRATSLAGVVASVEPLLRHAAAERGVALRRSVPAELPAVQADAGQLQQVLLNLVVNAIDAAPASGEVSVSGASVSREGQDGVELTVADNGPGIPEELLPRLFEPFFTTKPRGQGTGLGLAICRDIVQAHAGDIRIESKAEAGTTVTVWLPVARTPPA